MHQLVAEKLLDLGLFEPEWYVQRYPDVALTGIDPLQHYLQIGALLRRHPHPLFNATYYSETERFVATSGLFHPRWYARQYPDVADTGLTPLQHYVRFGAVLQRNPNPLFDTAYYLGQVVDHRLAQFNPLTHYMHNGWQNGLKPHPDFDPQEYLQKNLDVAAAGLEPLRHYLRHGRFEGRDGPLKVARTKQPGLLRRVITYKSAVSRFASLALRVLKSGVFDGAWYLRQNPNLATTKWPAIYHFVERGCREDPSRDFCAQEYLHMNPDVARAGIPAILHYERYGKATGRLTSLLEVGEAPTFPPDAVEFTEIFKPEAPRHRRTAIFASYSGDGRIASHVIYYLKGLKDVCDNIVFVTDSPLFKDESAKLEGLVRCMIVSRHGEYDFGSYKRGWDWLHNHDGLRDVDELIFCNDSCYGPFLPLKEAFETMDRRRCDFWGLSAFHMPKKGGKDLQFHLQSFFYVFKARVLESPVFGEFMNRIRKLPEPVRENVIATFEFSLTQELQSAGFQWRALIPKTFSIQHGAAPTYFGGLTMEKFGMPLLKIKTSAGVSHAESPLKTLEVAKRYNPELFEIVAPNYELRMQSDSKRKTRYRPPTIDFEKHQASFPTKIEMVRSRVAAGKPVRTTFLVGSPAMFPSLPLFRAMQGDSIFAPRIVVIPGSALVMADVDSRIESLRAILPGADIRSARRRDNEDFYEDISLDSDIVVYNSPYSSAHFFYSPRFSYGRKFLPIHFNYGYYRSVYDRHVMRMDNYAYFWKAFFENTDVLEEYKQHSIIAGRNAELTGYVKMDALADKLRRGKPDRYCIMIALHHSVEGGANDVLQLATFTSYAEYFQSLPARYPHIDFIFRPHPALFNMLARPKHWGKERVTAWRERFQANPNVRWSEAPDYLQDFADSDGIIQDCGSFLVEYLYTDKPCCYMLHSPKDIAEKFTPFGQDCLRQCYLAYRIEDIEQFIDVVILQKSDTLQPNRAAFAREKVCINYPRAAHKALDQLKIALI